MTEIQKEIQDEDGKDTVDTQEQTKENIKNVMARLRTTALLGHEEEIQRVVNRRYEKNETVLMIAVEGGHFQTVQRSMLKMTMEKQL